MKPIKIILHPYSVTKKSIADDSSYATEKSENNQKRRYLTGIASGIFEDHHGDRMSEAAIDDMIAQAEDKDILLLVNHGKDYTDDVAILTKIEKTKDNELYVEFRLYDESDKVPQIKKDQANTIWEQITGTGVYTKQRVFGFSIEGYVEDEDIEKTENGRVINKVDLDPGITLVTKPAYKTSVAHAVAKCLGRQPVRKTVIDEILNKDNVISDFFESRWSLNSALTEAVDSVLKTEKPGVEKTELINEILDDYKIKMIALIERLNYSFPESENTDSKLLRNRNKGIVLKKAVAVLQELSQKLN